MRRVFADTLYWVAIARPNDSWGEAARTARAALGAVELVTTEEVLSEFLAALSKGGPFVRRIAVKMVQEILTDASVQVVPQSHTGFLNGLDRFAAREDKSYSLTDCVSMNVMQSQDIIEVLTNDYHFAQDGFTPLVRA